MDYNVIATITELLYSALKMPHVQQLRNKVEQFLLGFSKTSKIKTTCGHAVIYTPQDNKSLCSKSYHKVAHVPTVMLSSTFNDIGKVTITLGTWVPNLKCES